MLRLVETGFRRKEVLILPAIVVPILAVLLYSLMAPQYQTTAVAWVDSGTLLGTSGSAAGDANEREAERLTELLSTDSFRLDLLESAGLLDRATQGQWPPPSPGQQGIKDLGLDGVPGLRTLLRSVGLVVPDSPTDRLNAATEAVGNSITVAEDGGNLLRVHYRGSDPHAAAPLVDAVIVAYRDRAVRLQSENLVENVSFYTAQLERQDTRVREAFDRLHSFLLANPAPPLGQVRDAAESAELDELRQSFSVEQAIFEDLVRTLESTRISSEVLVANEQQRIRVIDPAVAPQVGGIGVKNIVFIALTGAVGGLALGVAVLMWLTWLDPKLRVREDAVQAAPASAHLVVPQAPMAPGRWPHVGRLLAEDL